MLILLKTAKNHKQEQERIQVKRNRKKLGAKASDMISQASTVSALRICHEKTRDAPVTSATPTASAIIPVKLKEPRVKPTTNPSTCLIQCSCDSRSSFSRAIFIMLRSNSNNSLGNTFTSYQKTERENRLNKLQDIKRKLMDEFETRSIGWTDYAKTETLNVGYNQLRRQYNALKSENLIKRAQLEQVVQKYKATQIDHDTTMELLQNTSVNAMKAQIRDVINNTAIEKNIKDQLEKMKFNSVFDAARLKDRLAERNRTLAAFVRLESDIVKEQRKAKFQLLKACDYVSQVRDDLNKKREFKEQQLHLKKVDSSIVTRHYTNKQHQLSEIIYKDQEIHRKKRLVKDTVKGLIQDFQQNQQNKEQIQEKLQEYSMIYKHLQQIYEASQFRIDSEPFDWDKLSGFYSALEKFAELSFLENRVKEKMDKQRRILQSYQAKEFLFSEDVRRVQDLAGSMSQINGSVDTYNQLLFSFQEMMGVKSSGVEEYEGLILYFIKFVGELQSKLEVISEQLSRINCIESYPPPLEIINEDQNMEHLSESAIKQHFSHFSSKDLKIQLKILQRCKILLYFLTKEDIQKLLNQADAVQSDIPIQLIQLSHKRMQSKIQFQLKAFNYSLIHFQQQSNQAQENIQYMQPNPDTNTNRRSFFASSLLATINKTDTIQDMKGQRSASQIMKPTHYIIELKQYRPGHPRIRKLATLQSTSSSKFQSPARIKRNPTKNEQRITHSTSLPKLKEHVGSFQDIKSLSRSLSAVRNRGNRVPRISRFNMQYINLQFCKELKQI